MQDIQGGFYKPPPLHLVLLDNFLPTTNYLPAISLSPIQLVGETATTPHIFTAYELREINAIQSIWVCQWLALCGKLIRLTKRGCEAQIGTHFLQFALP